MDPQIELPYDFVLYQKDDAIAYKNLKKQLKALSHEKNICPELLSNKNLCNDYFYKLHYGQTPILQSSWYLECVGKIELNYQA